MTQNKRPRSASVRISLDISQKSPCTKEEKSIAIGRVPAAAHDQWKSLRNALIARTIPYFGQLENDTRDDVLGMTNEEHFEAGEYIVRQGDVGSRFYLILDGSVKILQSKQGGKEVELANLRPGHGFGEMALLTSEPRVASAKATSATSCIGLSKQSFNAAMKKEGKVASFLYKLLEERQGVRERRNLRERSASRNSTHNYLNRGNSCTNRGDGSPLVNGTKSNSTSDNDKENQLRGFGGLKDTIDDGKKCGEATSTPTTDKTAFTTKGQEAMYKTPCTYAENAYYERSASGSIEGTPSSSFFSRQEVEPVTLTKSLTCTKSINGRKYLMISMSPRAVLVRGPMEKF